jgi:hypothetical protein
LLLNYFLDGKYVVKANTLNGSLRSKNKYGQRPAQQQLLLLLAAAFRDNRDFLGQLPKKFPFSLYTCP